MFSIGILGFIVWSQMVASLYCKIKVNNITIGWKDLMLLVTFYSTNTNNMVPLAGNSNINWGSSEIICNSDFKLFRSIYLFYFNHPFEESDQWLYWLIGFIEGDGAILEHKGRLQLVITQKDKKVLQEIEQKKGFGKVTQFSGFSRYKIVDNPGAFMFYCLLNGKLILSHRVNQLKKWYLSFFNKSKLNISKRFNIENIPDFIEITFLPNLGNAWLSGFTDAEGCFSLTINNKNNNIRCRYILDQKFDFQTLKAIQDLFQYGTVYKRSETLDVYRLVINMNKPTRDKFYLLIDYLQRFSLKTSKSQSFIYWKEVIDVIAEKKHKTKEGFEKIQRLKKLINKYTIENNPKGLASFS